MAPNKNTVTLRLVMGRGARGWVMSGSDGHFGVKAAEGLMRATGVRGERGVAVQSCLSYFCPLPSSFLLFVVSSRDVTSGGFCRWSPQPGSLRLAPPWWLRPAVPLAMTCDLQVPSPMHLLLTPRGGGCQVTCVHVRWLVTVVWCRVASVLPVGPSPHVFP